MRKVLSLIGILLCFIMFISCGSSKNASSTETYDSIANTSSEDEKYDYEGVDDSYSEVKNEENIYSSQDERKIINRADLTIETTEFNDSINSLESLTTNLGGYIESSNLFQQGINQSSYNENRSGDFVVRIPKESFQKFLNDSGNFGIVTNKRVYGEDITGQYYDREGRLKVLKAQEERYLEILKGANEIEQVLEVEKYLTEVRYEIESLTGTLKQMDNLVDYSTVNISIVEVTEVSEAQKVPKTLGEKIGRAFSDSINSLKIVSTGVILVLIAIIPYAIILLIMAGIVYYIVKNIRKNHNKKKE